MCWAWEILEVGGADRRELRTRRALGPQNERSGSHAEKHFSAGDLHASLHFSASADARRRNQCCSTAGFNVHACSRASSMIPRRVEALGKNRPAPQLGRVLGHVAVGREAPVARVTDGGGPPAAIDVREGAGQRRQVVRRRQALGPNPDLVRQTMEGPAVVGRVADRLRECRSTAARATRAAGRRHERPGRTIERRHLRRLRPRLARR